jgi:putative FmdB family regulatory protein
MPTYTYQCHGCSYSFDVVQSFREDTLTHCLSCDTDQLRRVLYAPIVLDTTPKTVGGLADRNRDRTLGRYELEALQQQRELARAESREYLQQNLPQGMSTYDTGSAQGRPWFRSTETINNNLTKLTPQEKANYIMTGDSRGS